MAWHVKYVLDLDLYRHNNGLYATST